MSKGIMGNAGVEAAKCFSISQTSELMLPFLLAETM